jgi:predicted aldo/keto reductase-like oxidoreductase
MPCSADVNIAECFEIYNQGCMFDAQKIARGNYKIILGGFLAGAKGFASQCTECGDCEEKCPQHIEIREGLKEVVAYVGC